MDHKHIETVKKHLDDINKTITSLDPAIRAAAFDILAPLYFGEYHSSDGGDADAEKKHGLAGKAIKATPNDGFEKFFSSHEHTKPADNVTLIAAWLYSQHGITPITSGLCRDISGQVGFTIPNRPDNTMRQAREQGKTLFRQQGKGWVLTTHGELFVKETYQVRKGNLPLPEAEAK